MSAEVPMGEAMLEAAEAWVRARDAAAALEREIGALTLRLAEARASEQAARDALMKFGEGEREATAVEPTTSAKVVYITQGDVLRFLDSQPEGKWVHGDDIIAALLPDLERGSADWVARRKNLQNIVADLRRKRDAIENGDEAGHSRGWYRLKRKKAEGGDPPPA